MAEVHFHPHFVEVLEQLVRRAENEGAIDVEVRADLDPEIIAAQIRRYAGRSGRPLVCIPSPGKVEVATAAHPSLGRTG